MYVLYTNGDEFNILLSSRSRFKLEAEMDNRLEQSAETERRLSVYQAKYDAYVERCKAIVREYFTTNIDAIEFHHKDELVRHKTKKALIKKFESNFRTCFEEPLCIYLNRDKLPPFPKIPEWREIPPKGFRVDRDHIHIMEVEEV